MGGKKRMIQLKKRTPETELKKVLIYGNDGTGKSTFAEKYCEKNNLKPICIDVDDTNYTQVPIIEMDIRGRKVTDNIIEIINEIKKTDEYDAIILDGVSSLLELIVPPINDQRAWLGRAKNFNKILNKLLESDKHLIFIGQADMAISQDPSSPSPKPIIKVNSMVNEKYYCMLETDGTLRVQTEKLRGADSLPSFAFGRLNKR